MFKDLILSSITLRHIQYMPDRYIVKLKNDRKFISTINLFLVDACRHGDIELLKLCTSLVAYDHALRVALRVAHEMGNYECVLFLSSINSHPLGSD